MYIRSFIPENPCVVRKSSIPSVKSLTLKSFAKVNLFLKVVTKRPDGYHTLNTLFERINLFDTITLKLRLADNEIRLSAHSRGLPKDITQNLVFRSARLLQERFNVSKGVAITLTKRIPIGAGLGGGSSNAATVLVGLNKLWGLHLSREKLLACARELGSDVPFFVYQTSFALGEGRGEKIKLLKALENVRVWHLLIMPRLKVSTPFIYRQWDSFRGLTSAKYNVKIVTSALQQKDLTVLSGVLFNDLQQVTQSFYPEITRIQHALTEVGLKAILMSGSGPAVFAIVSSRKEAFRAAQHLRHRRKEWQFFCVKTA